MKRRTPQAAPTLPAERPAGPGDPPPPAGARDWTADTPVNRKLEQAAVASATAAREAAQGMYNAGVAAVVEGSKKFADDVSNTDADDVVMVTIGKETFYPVKHNGLEVGPLSITVRVRPGETAGEAYTRARIVLEHLFETEFQVRMKDFVDHLERARLQVRGAE